MFTNEWPLKLDELFMALNLFSEFSTVIVWQLSPRQTDYYQWVITMIRQWPFLWMHFSLWIAGKRFLLSIHHPSYVTGHPGCVLSFLLPDWRLLQREEQLWHKFQTPYLYIHMAFAASKRRFLLQEKINQKRKPGKRTIPQAFVGGKSSSNLI